jgi:hypothetical protein
LWQNLLELQIATTAALATGQMVLQTRAKFVPKGAILVEDLMHAWIVSLEKFQRKDHQDASAASPEPFQKTARVLLALQVQQQPLVLLNV